MRSSDESLYVLGGDLKTYDFKPHATARDIFRNEIMKPSIGGSSDDGQIQSNTTSNVYAVRKS